MRTLKWSLKVRRGGLQRRKGITKDSLSTLQINFTPPSFLCLHSYTPVSVCQYLELNADFNINLGRSSPWMTREGTGNCTWPLIGMLCACGLAEGLQRHRLCGLSHLHPDMPPAASCLDFACIQLDEGQESEVLRTTNKLIDMEQVFKNQFYYLWDLVQKLSSHIS